MPSTIRSAEFALLARLRHSTALRALGCNAVRGLSGTICLSMPRTSVGAWWYEAGAYRFAPVAHHTPVCVVTSAEEAVEKTVAVALNHAATPRPGVSH